MSFGWTFSCFSAHLIVCKSTSAIRKVPGNAARTKTPIYCYGNTSRETRTCPPFLGEHEGHANDDREPE